LSPVLLPRLKKQKKAKPPELQGNKPYVDKHLTHTIKGMKCSFLCCDLKRLSHLLGYTFLEIETKTSGPWTPLWWLPSAWYEVVI
jgi:hypothetical protein